MASRFATVSKGEILVVIDVAAPKNTTKETKFGLSLEKNFSLNVQQEKMIPDTLSVETCVNKL